MLSTVWRIILGWYFISAALLMVTRQWNVVFFSFSFGLLYGGVTYKSRRKIRMFFERRRMNRFPVFILIAIMISVVEELYVYALGNTIAVPNIRLDVVIVPAEWSVWFTVWYFFLSKKYRFGEQEALFAAGLVGLFYEYAGNFKFLDILGFLVSIPGTLIVYAAIFVLPMQMISFSGDVESRFKYPVAGVLPFVITIPVSLLIFSLLK